MFITGSLNDVRVPFYHPLKFLAKVRWSCTLKMFPDHFAVLKMSDSGGHFDESDPISAVAEDAEQFAFLALSIDQAKAKAK